MQIEIKDGEFHVDASLLAFLLGIAPADITDLMKSQAITSICERGVDTDAGRFRLTFFYRSRRARLNVDSSGTVLQRSSLDYGGLALPPNMRRTR